MGAIVSALAFPNPPRDASASVLEQHAGLTWLQTASGLKIPAIHLQPATSSSTSGNTTTRPTILYSHGNAEDLGIILPYLQMVANTTDCPICCYEYPGYSIAQGAKASERGCYEAIEAAYQHLRVDHGVDRIVAFGRSLGTGPTVHLCAKMSTSHDSALQGCILQSPLASAIRCVMDTCAATSLYPIDIFRNHDKIHLVTCPVFILHGQADTVVPFVHGKTLYAALQERTGHNVDYPPLWIPNRGHNDMPEMLCLKQCRAFVTFLVDRVKK